MDGMSKDDDYAAGCGGVVQDSSGRWLCGYMLNLGSMDPLPAEIWSIWKGLKLLWGRGFWRVALESDLKEALNRIFSRKPSNLDPLIHEIHGLLNNDWEVTLNHNLREANVVANWLAASALAVNPGLQVLNSPPEMVLSFLQRDMEGAGIVCSIGVSLV